MPDDDREHDADDAEARDEGAEEAEREASDAEAQGDAAGDAAEGEAAEAESRPDAEGDAAESDASEAEAEGDAEGDAVESEASEAEAAETEGDEAERRAAEEEVREAEAEDNEFGIDQKRMPFTQHLVELRYRILVSLGAVAGAFVLLFLLLSPYVYDAMTLPVLRACVIAGIDFNALLVSRKPTEMIITVALMCALAAIVLTSPWTFYQVWEFVAPGLRKKERRAFIPILSIGTGLFVLGAAFAYMLVVPLALQFLMTYTLKYKGVKLLWNIGDTLKFEAMLMLVFGVAFEMPLVMTALTRVGLVSPEMLVRKRRHCIVAMFLIGALLTPPDVVTQICLAVPLVVLFEISILASRFFKPKRTIWEGWDEQDDELGEEWDREAAAAESTPASDTGAAGTTDDTGETGYDDSYDYGESEYYDEYGEYGDEDTYEDGMGDDIGWSEDEDGQGEEAPDEEAPPADGEDEPPAAEATGEEPADDAEQPDEQGGEEDGPDDPKP